VRDNNKKNTKISPPYHPPTTIIDAAWCVPIPSNKASTNNKQTRRGATTRRNKKRRKELQSSLKTEGSSHQPGAKQELPRMMQKTNNYTTS
jgi:hypothetical protein